MAFSLASIRAFSFSIFKKKVSPLRTGAHKTPEQLYASLSAFEAQLTPLQVKKMPKALQSFQKKFRRLLRQHQQKTIDVQMELSQTFQSYMKNVDELTFGTEELQQQTTLQQMRDLTAQMAKCDLNPYLRCLIPKYQSHTTLSQRFQQRFVNIEQRVCREIYQGYIGFSRNVSRIAFLQEREYKGDFKFQLVGDIEIVEMGIEAMYNCALFNKLRDKLALACELAMTTLGQRLSDASLGRLLFCLANAGRPLKNIEQNLHSIRERMEGCPLELLYYMMATGLEDAVWFEMLSNKLVITPRNGHEQSIAKMIQIILDEKFKCKIAVREKEQYGRTVDKHEGQLFFQNFLQRYGYEYSSTALSLFPYTLYTIQGKSFLCYDSLAIKDESFALSGAGMIITQYFHDKSQGIKHINWPRMLTMDKRGERDEYILSKFKGIERPKRVKVRYYE